LPFALAKGYLIVFRKENTSLAEGKNHSRSEHHLPCGQTSLKKDTLSGVFFIPQ